MNKLRKDQIGSTITNVLISDDTAGNNVLLDCPEPGAVVK